MVRINLDRFPFSSLPLKNTFNSALHTYRHLVSDVMGLDQPELDRLVEGALAVISGCAAAGWEIGTLLGGAEGGLSGVLVGTTIGVVVVVGGIAYRIWIRPSSADGRYLARMETISKS